MLLIILGVVCGCPLFAVIMNCCMTVRCMAGTYEMTGGVTCMELVCRCILVCCVTFNKTFKEKD